MTIEVINFGCRLNVYEGQTIKDQALAAGLENTIVFNSCAVTSEAERQVRQAIRKARKENPNAKLVVTGCSAQINPKQYLDMGEVDAVLGNDDKMRVESYALLSESRKIEVNRESELSPSEAAPHMGDSMLKYGGIQEQRAIVNDIFSVKETASHLVSAIEGHSRAFVQVQNGCDHRCTFCIIPFGRGNSRSVPVGEVVEQVKKLVGAGYKEVVLTGVDVSDYGKALPGEPSLGQLVKRLLRLVPDLPRLRISSIDAAEVDDDIYDMLANEPRLMPHMHLSLQSGNDMVLKRMKRRHLRDNILDFCDKVRALRPDIVFGADIIAGFPTETDEMFADTLNLVDEAGLTYLHVFPYSAREGTPAAKMPQVPMAVRKARAATLRAKGKEREQLFYESLIGTTQRVLVEKQRSGHTEQFAEIKLHDDFEIGGITPVVVQRDNSGVLIGIQPGSA